MNRLIKHLVALVKYFSILLKIIYYLLNVTDIFIINTSNPFTIRYNNNNLALINQKSIMILFIKFLV